MFLRLFFAIFSTLFILSCADENSNITGDNTYYSLSTESCSTQFINLRLEERLFGTFGKVLMPTGDIEILDTQGLNEEFLRFKGEGHEGFYAKYPLSYGPDNIKAYQYIVDSISKISGGKLPDMGGQYSGLPSVIFPHRSHKSATFILCDDGRIIIRKDFRGDLKIVYKPISNYFFSGNIRKKHGGLHQ